MSNPNQVATKDISVQSTQSERFLKNVETQFAAEAGSPIAFSEYEKTLAQHLFLKVDNVLKDLETKRLSASSPYGSPYTWANVNMRKMALDAVHRVQLGLDALIPNHIHPVPYFNKREGKYDLDLRVGYVGKAYYRRAVAVDVPVDIICELVYSTDEFKPMKKSFSNEIESYEFNITNAFKRGEIIGGFGYLVYEDSRKNTLIMVSEEDFEKSKKAAQSDAFWKKHPVEMRFKTLVHRVTEKLEVDPKKVNATSYAYVESQEEEAELRREVNENANEEILDIQIDEPKKPNVDKQTGEILNAETEPEPVSEPVVEHEKVDENKPDWA
jgi:recombination protein RecT